MEFSVIIPAFNEQELIGQTLTALGRQLQDRDDWELIVVDNGSTDTTPKIAKFFGAKVIVKTEVTVAQLRNFGVAASSGRVLCFLDADVIVTQQWGNHLNSTLLELERNPLQITGSRCGVSQHPGWIERNWFAPLETRPMRYINSGHLLTTRQLHDFIGGFDAGLTTGEDSDYCRRAREEGASIEANPVLRVIHDGYPKTLIAFLKREIWHGRGDVQTLELLLRSRTALAMMAFSACHVAVLIGVGFLSWPMVLTSAFLIALICLLSSLHKYRDAGIRPVLINALLYYIYYVGRSTSLFKMLLTKEDVERSPRSGLPNVEMGQ